MLKFFLSERARVLRRVALMMAGVVVVPLVAFGLLPVPEDKDAEYPDWWFERGVIAQDVDPIDGTPEWPEDYPAADNHASLTLGQLKQFGSQAYAEIKDRYEELSWTVEGTAPYALEQMVMGWYEVYPTEGKVPGYAKHLATVGQLKNVSKHVYDVLSEVGYIAGADLPPPELVGVYPWTDTTEDDDNKAIANIGQAKMLFSFDLKGFDTDGDGLADNWENLYWSGDLAGVGHEAEDDVDRDGLSNEEEYRLGLNPEDTDGDYDGRMDGDEVADGTDPKDANSFEELRLGYWKFETAELRSERLSMPLVAANNTLSAAWRGKGLDVTVDNNSRVLYKDVEADGRPNINLRRGSVRFWIKPNWTSGTGPGGDPRVLELGAWSVGNTGWWALVFDGLGTSLSLATQNGGTAKTNVGKSITWTAGTWYQVVVTYDPTETRIYVNGDIANEAVGSGMTLVPSATVRAGGFSIATDRNNDQRTKSVIDEVETFNYVLPEEKIAADYAEASMVDVDGDGLPDAWEMTKFGNLDPLETDDADNDGLSNYDEWLRGLEPKRADTDWDGNSDLQELADGTDPDDFDSYTGRRIAYFSFDGPGYALPSGELPKRLNNNPEQVTPGWKGKGLRIDTLGELLSYKWVGDSGEVRFSPHRGTVRLWFKTDWATTAMSGYWSRFVNVGYAGDQNVKSYWSLQVHATTNQLMFDMADGAGHRHQVGRGASWAANGWHELVFTYEWNKRTFYLDGAQVGQDLVNWVYSWKVEDLEYSGIMLGSDASQPLKGVIDEVEIFNRVLTGAEIAADYAAEAAAHADTDSDGLWDAWEMLYYGSLGTVGSGNLTGDADGDLVNNQSEMWHGTDPDLVDTDGDGRSDAQEIAEGTDPLVADGPPRDEESPQDPPTDIAVETLEPGHHEVTWTNNGSAGMLNIVQRTGNGKTWKTVGVVAGNATSFTDETAEPELPYFYRVGVVR